MTLCEHCQEREGTIRFNEDGGVLDFVHGFFEMWCEVCVLKAQIARAEERASALPAMRARLEELLK